MARRYYRRRTVTVRPKKKWASNMKIHNFVIQASNPVPYVTLVANSLAGALPTPTIVKCGNFKINADVSLEFGASSSNLFNVVALVLYIPEGMGPTNNAGLGSLVTAHPEYVIGWKQFESENVGTDQTKQTQRVTFSSRLKRNLNSGDQVAFAILDQTPTVEGSSVLDKIRVSFTCQYWTCSN